MIEEETQEELQQIAASLLRSLCSRSSAVSSTETGVAIGKTSDERYPDGYFPNTTVVLTAHGTVAEECRQRER